MVSPALDVAAIDQAHRLYERLQLACGRSVCTEHLMDSVGIETESGLSMRMPQIARVLRATSDSGVVGAALALGLSMAGIGLGGAVRGLRRRNR